jgi:hypothetical protein
MVGDDQIMDLECLYCVGGPMRFTGRKIVWLIGLSDLSEDYSVG